MFGDVVYRNGLYCEYAIAEDGNVKVVVCVQLSTIKLYRIE